MAAVAAFEVGNIAATLLILRATELLTPAHGIQTATTTELLLLNAGYNLAASAIAGLLWTAFSPTVAFAYLVAWMLIAATGLLLTRRRTT